MGQPRQWVETCEDQGGETGYLGHRHQRHGHEVKDETCETHTTKEHPADRQQYRLGTQRRRYCSIGTSRDIVEASLRAILSALNRRLSLDVTMSA